ncbi:MAG: very short patch repair endonuclease, partial [Candidatus Adiutrix sp.]|nr:very short patch repair endonuclease [Candidatus Adiutrix sp.]
KGKDTVPEKRVRSLLHRLGFRFRLHRRDLPGAPDIVLPKKRTVIFVHGCFWHRHPGCARASRPASNQAYWDRKFARNQARDAANQARLTSFGWRVIIIWECELKDMDLLENRLLGLLSA